MIANLSELRVLRLSRHRLTKETIQTIITLLNLKSFWFRCREMSSSLMQEMAKNQKQLTDLQIYFSRFVEYKRFTKVVIFESVRHLFIQNPKMSPNYFEQIVGMFPNINKFEYLLWNSIQYEDDEEDLNCETCLYKTFEAIPRLQSLRYLGTCFKFYGKKLFECLDRLPNLSYLRISCDHYLCLRIQSDIQEIIDYLISICESNPQRLIKFKLDCNHFYFPSGFKRPRNLKIIGTIFE